MITWNWGLAGCDIVPGIFQPFNGDLRHAARLLRFNQRESIEATKRNKRSANVMLAPIRLQPSLKGSIRRDGFIPGNAALGIMTKEALGSEPPPAFDQKICV